MVMLKAQRKRRSGTAPLRLGNFHAKRKKGRKGRKSKKFLVHVTPNGINTQEMRFSFNTILHPIFPETGNGDVFKRETYHLTNGDVWRPKEDTVSIEAIHSQFERLF
ncbi:hypothetical protein CEXT_178211 [Caerostris extrusa]|uniref:Uncharacterized protein n=1 Tax=Caerostris extrusa TaxID=172846 RepID=A0AAV4VGV2_CAEEX|nr:hypothetical protein CEXT_178211 [Caerostris extrusa]